MLSKTMSEIVSPFFPQLSLNSQHSMDSRASNLQVYAVTSYYKGQLVAIKKYEIKSLVINRKMQKEMKVVGFLCLMVYDSH